MRIRPEVLQMRGVSGMNIDNIFTLVNLYLNPFDLKVDSEGWWFEHSVS